MHVLHPYSTLPCAVQCFVSMHAARPCPHASHPFQTQFSTGPELGCWQAHKAAQEGDTAAAEALYSQTVDVTPEMAHELAIVLRGMVQTPCSAMNPAVLAL